MVIYNFKAFKMHEIAQPDCYFCNARLKSVFHELNAQETQELNSFKFCKIFRKGQTVFEEGAYPLGLYCVNNGKIKITQAGADGREQIIHLAKNGDVMGYRALLADDKYSCSAIALEDSSLCFIPAKVFINMVDQNAKLALRMIHLFSDELKAAEKAITDIAQKTVKERLAQSILLLNQCYGTEKDGKTINVQITRAELANIVGTARETIIRSLLELEKEKAIELVGKKIRILEKDKLIATANVFD
jgi:CRP/FNR family transcriptional regulator